MRKQVLVTGGAGFIGSHLSRRLLADGFHVVSIDNLSTGSLENVPSGAEFIQRDLTREDALRDAPRGPYVAVCHLAGQSSGEKSFENPLYDFDANTRSTLWLAQWALKHRVSVFLHASSMGVYGQTGPGPVSEAATPRPVSYYGASKYSAEQILQIASREGLRSCSFRMFSVYGPGQDLAEMRQGMVSIYLAYLLKGEPLVVRGSLERTRDFVYVDDVVEAWARAIEQPVSGALNLASGHGTTVRSLIAQLLTACGLDERYPVKEEAATPGDQHGLYADITAIHDALGWEPRVTLREGLARMVAWARSLHGVEA